MADDLERFYAILAHIEDRFGRAPVLAELTGRSPWPARGVYFFREPGEHRIGRSDVMRVARVGTHAVGVGSRSTLWSRLRAHRGGRMGGGNHRGSIFRLHVGAALLVREGLELATWGSGSSAPKEIRLTEAEHERQVSEYLGRMSVQWLDVPDDPGPQSARCFIERNAIALLSNHLMPFDPPSPRWLGQHSPEERIRRSGLWNLNYVGDTYDAAFVDVMSKLAR